MSDERIKMESPREQDLKPACSSLSLCSTCRQMFAIHKFPEDFGELKYHTSRENLLAAAEQRCYVCLLLRDRLADSELPARSPTDSGSDMLSWWTYTVSDGDKDNMVNFFHCHLAGSSTALLELAVCVLESCKKLATDCSGQTTWSTAIKERARQWLRDESAEEAVSNPTTFLPKRLLQVRALEDDQYKVLLCEDHTLPRGTQYLTLSHCWGQSKFLRLLKNNIEEFKQCIRYQLLPKNFRDAIKITCDLDFTYIWIDSLCIIQDSTEDWLSQGSIMGQIYQNAACNISADVAQDSEAGLIRARDIETFLPLKLDAEWWAPHKLNYDPRQRYLFVHEPWETVSGAHLANRAWVFQERLLSQKIIHFTTRQVFFETKASIEMANNFSEQWPHGVPDSDLLSTEVDDHIHWWLHMTGGQKVARWESWTSYVERYSLMKLTYDTDRLAALSGVVKEVQRYMGDEYLAGLWKEDLLRQLLWNSSPECSSNRTRHYTAPTWSWASVQTPVRYRFIPYDYENTMSRTRVLCKFVSAEISPMLDQDNTGAIKGGFLRLQGSLRQARLTQGDRTSKAQPYWTIGQSRRKIIFLPDIISPEDSKIRQVPEHHSTFLDRVFHVVTSFKIPPFLQSTIAVHAPTQSVFLLPILSTAFCSDFSLSPSFDDFATVGLALKPTDLVRGQFERVGLFLTVHLSEIGSILHHPCDIEESYYEKKDRGRYTISII